MKNYPKLLKANKIFLLLPALLISTISFAQETSGTNELMRSNGKIYVVVAVCLTILFALILYVIRNALQLFSQRGTKL